MTLEIVLPHILQLSTKNDLRGWGREEGDLSEGRSEEDSTVCAPHTAARARSLGSQRRGCGTTSTAQGKQAESRPTPGLEEGFFFRATGKL